MIYVTGDLHADISRFENIKLKKGDTLIVCGDFGFIWDNNNSENKLIRKIGKFPFKTLFVDGTHENFNILNTFKIEDFASGKAGHISGNLYHLLRGHIYTIEEKTFFTFGGGESIDKDMRQICNKYWEEELPSINEMKFAVDNLNKVNRKVDYIITHEPPAKIKVLFNERLNNINTLNRYFDEVSEHVDYKRWFFGSVHKDRKIPPKYIALFTAIMKITDD